MTRKTVLPLVLVALTSVATVGSASRATADTSDPDRGGDTYCSQLSTDSGEQCVPTDRGPGPAWDLAAGKWRQPPGPTSAPVVALWAAPSAPLDDLALNRGGAFAAFSVHLDQAMAFAKGKNAESYLASLRRQKEVLDRITARKAELGAR
jgi:hypothetical protein